jgi:hypothetical protein
LKPYSVEPSGRSSPTSRCPADVNAFFLRPKRVDAILVSDAVVVPPLEFVPFRIDTVTFTSLYVPLALFVDDSPKRPSRPASLQNFGREFAELIELRLDFLSIEDVRTARPQFPDSLSEPGRSAMK